MECRVDVSREVGHEFLDRRGRWCEDCEDENSNWILSGSILLLPGAEPLAPVIHVCEMTTDEWRGRVARTGKIN